MRTRTLLAAVAALTLAACGSSGAPDEVVNGVAVYTQPAQATFVASGNTYFVNPSVRFRKDGQTQPDIPMPTEVSDAITAGMDAAGFVAAPEATASVALTMVYATSSVDVWYSGGWCDIYYGWYGCYYPPVYAGSYRVGLAILNLVDKGLTTPEALWTANVYGLTPDYTLGGIYPAPRLVEAVDRAFSQSPYIVAP